MSKFEKGGGDNEVEDGRDNATEVEVGVVDKNILAARKEVEAMGGVEVLKTKLKNASVQTKESLALLFKGTPFLFFVFAAIGIAPSELGAILGKWTQDSVGHPSTYQEALEFGAYGAATFGAVGASMAAFLGTKGSIKNWVEKMRLSHLKKKAHI